MVPERPGCSHAGAARHDLQRLHRRAGGCEHRERIGLGVERIRHGRTGPVSSHAFCGRKAVAHAGCCDELVLRSITPEHLSDFEQCDIGVAAIGVGLRGSDEARQQARPHVGQIGGNRVGERECGLSAAEQFGMRLRNERPRHGFHHAACGQRALGAAGAVLHRGQHRLAGIVAALERRHRHLVDADDAHDFLDDVGLAVHVGAPGGDGDLHHRSAAGDHEAEMGQDAARFDQRHVDSRQPFDLAQREVDDAVFAEGLADDDIFRRRAAAHLHDEPGRQLKSRHHEGRIDAALETIARVGIDAELAAGLRDVDLVPQRRIRSARPWCSRRSRKSRRP